MRHFDAVVLGSSPPLLSLAIRLAKSNKKVLVLEKRNYLGGAWKVTSFGGFQDTDSYCHIFVQDFDSFKIMKNNLGWSLAKVKPQPVFLYKGYKLHYNNPLRYLIAILEPLTTQKKHKSNPSVWDVKNFKLSEVFEFFRILWQTFLTTIIRSISYPVGASAEIMEKLSKQLKDNEVEVELGKKIQRIDIYGGNKIIACEDQQISFSKIYLSTGSELKEVQAEGHAWKPKHMYLKSHNLHLIVKDSEPTQPISYVYLGYNAKIGRVYEPPNTKVKYQVNHERMIIIQLRNKFIEDNPEKSVQLEQVFLELKSLKIVGSNAKILDSQFDIFESSRLEESALNRLSTQYPDDFQYMHVTNLSRGIHESFRVPMKAAGDGEDSLNKSHFRGSGVRRLGVEKLARWLSDEHLLNPEALVLDYGCGEFDLGQTIHNQVLRADGYDIRESAVERCRKLNLSKKSKFYASPTNIPKKAYDLILLNGVVQYMDGEKELRQFFKDARGWISEKQQSQMILTCIIEEGYSPVKDAVSWSKAAYRRGLFLPMLSHLIWGGWNTVIAKNNPTLVLSFEKVKNIAAEEGWSCERRSEDLTYSDKERATYILKPIKSFGSKPQFEELSHR